MPMGHECEQRPRLAVHKQLSPGPGTGVGLEGSQSRRKDHQQERCFDLGTCSMTESITDIKQKAITNPSICHWWGHRVWATEGRDISARGLRRHEDILSFWVGRCDGVYSELRIHYKGFS